VTPESELLLACVRPQPDPAAIREQARRTIDWARWRELAEFHCVAPLVYWRLQQTCPDGAPAGVLYALGERFRASAERGLWLTAELLEVLERFEAAGVEAVALKGPVLAWWVYGHPALREYLDLDVLVPPAHVTRAREALLARGYHLKAALDGPLERNFRRWLGQMSFVREDLQVAVDLHWTLAPPAFGLRLESGTRVRVQIGSREVPTLGPEDTLLLLAYHGAKHGWTPLNFLCDLAMLLAAVPIDFEGALERAAGQRMTRRLLLGLSLAHELLGVDLPASVWRQLTADRRVTGLAAEVRQGLLDGRPAPDESRFQRRVADRFRDGLRLWLASVFQPTEADWTALRIPPSLFSLYYLARPVRLLIKHGSSQARRLVGRSR
jgi:hypothetical protein